MEKIKKLRSREYPAFTLNETIEFVLSLADLIMLQSISYEAVAKQMNVSATTNSFKGKISAARQFGLVATSSGGTMSFLSAAKTFAFPTGTNDDIAQLKLQCFSTPKLYSELLNLYKDKPIPAQKSLENILTTRFGITSSAKEIAAKTFIETANEVGAVVGGILTLDIQPTSTQRKVQDEEQSDSSATISANETAHTTRHDVGDFSFEFPTLSGKTARLVIPRDVKIKDIDFIGKSIQNLLPDFLENLKDEIEQKTE